MLLCVVFCPMQVAVALQFVRKNTWSSITIAGVGMFLQLACGR